MARHPLLRQPTAPAHLIEVAVPWPRTHGTHPPSQGRAPRAPASSSPAETLAAYRRYRQRLADAVRPATPPAVHQTPAPREPSVTDLFDAEVLENATALYDPTLAYHNAGHALRAVASGERLLRVCSRAGVRVDATVVRLALLFHDAGYGTDPSTAGCADAEAYAATLARRTLTGRVPPSVLDDVETAILATRRATRPETPEAKVVRAADLAELAADYDTFAAHSEALRVEHERLSGAPMCRAEWGKSVHQLLSDYLEERLWPLDLLDDDSGQPSFHVTAKANLRRYLVQLH